MPAVFSILRIALRWLLAALFAFAGAMHFVKPDTYASVVPPYLPQPRLLVAISGVCEILGAVGVLLPPPLRQAAGWGLILLLVAVFPANVQMALHPAPVGGHLIKPIWLYLRLPLQAVLIAWVYWVAIATVGTGGTGGK